MLTSVAFLDFTVLVNGSGKPLTNCMPVKPSHVMLLSQSNLCITGDKQCDSEYRQMKDVRSE